MHTLWKVADWIQKAEKHGAVTRTYRVDPHANSQIMLMYLALLVRFRCPHDLAPEMAYDKPPHF